MKPGGEAAAPARAGEAVLSAAGLSKSYSSPNRGSDAVQLFRALDLEVFPGETVAIVGQSGAGKSSLLHLLAGLDQPSAGEVLLRGAPLQGLHPGRVAELRNRAIGFVWQFHYLLPEFSAVENVALPLLARGERRAPATAKARLWLERVGLAPRASHRAGELSGGEQQRVAMARALVTQPAVLLADEPTGDLDDRTAAELFALLQTICREEAVAVVLVTHNAEIARRCDRVLRLSGGRLEAVPQEAAGPTGEFPQAWR